MPMPLGKRKCPSANANGPRQMQMPAGKCKCKCRCRPTNANANASADILKHSRNSVTFSVNSMKKPSVRMMSQNGRGRVKHRHRTTNPAGLKSNRETCGPSHVHSSSSKSQSTSTETEPLGQQVQVAVRHAIVELENAGEDPVGQQ